MIRDLIAIFKTFGPKERLLFFGITLIFLLSVVFTGLIFFYANTVVRPASGGHYTEGIVGQPIAINPVLAANNDVDRDLVELTFSDLGDLLERYSTSTDGKTFTVTLRPELKWSDGDPLTADDVIFTLETIQNPSAHSPLLATWQGVVAERLSEREIRFTIKTPYIYFLDTLLSFKPIPAHIFESIPAANFRLSNFILEPISSGPYLFAASEKEKSGFFGAYHFSVNKNYVGREVHIPTVNVKFFQTYKDAIDALNRKEIDGLGGLSPSQLSELKITNQVFEFKIPRYYAIFFNQNTQPILKESAVRTALNEATNKKKLINAVFLNHALAVNGPILPYLEGYDPEIYASDAFSLEAASSTLEKAGWLVGEDGVRTKKTKNKTERLELELVVPQIPFLIETAELLKADWESIGIALTLNILPPLDINSSIITSRSYQMILFGNLVRGNSDVFSFWHSSQRFHPGLNLSLYEDKAADTLLESIRTEKDETKRLEMLSKLQKLIWQEDPAIFLYSPNYLYAAPRNLGGLESPFLNSAADRFKNISRWYLKTDRIFTNK